jgi:hypothetical protein
VYDLQVRSYVFTAACLSVCLLNLTDHPLQDQIPNEDPPAAQSLSTTFVYINVYIWVCALIGTWDAESNGN